MINIRRSALVRFTPAQMFDLVDDIDAYPRRFQWSAGAEELAREPSEVTARLDLRMIGLTLTFTTRNQLERPARISMSLVDGPFRQFNGVWTFSPLGDSGCKIALSLDFEVSGRLIGSALRLGFQGIADRLVDDFCAEAARVYG